MIRVLHFDYEPYTALGCVQMLEHRLKKYHSVDYMFLKTDIKSFEGSRKRIEELLPEKDVLLIHSCPVKDLFEHTQKHSLSLNPVFY